MLPRLISCFRCCTLKYKKKIMITTWSGSPYITFDNYLLVFANQVPFVSIFGWLTILHQYSHKFLVGHGRPRWL